MRNGVFIFMLSLNLLLVVPRAHAQTWGTSNIFSNLMMNVIENIQRQIEGALLGTLKVAATTMLNSKVGQMIGGSSAGDSMIISDWEQFLYVEPAQKAEVFMNDFFSGVTRGKYASANYSGIGDSSGNVEGNYPAYLVETTKKSMGLGEGDSSSMPCEYTLDEYADNPDVIFNDGDWQGFNAFFLPCNNPWGLQQVAAEVYAQKFIQEQEQAKLEATSPGLKAPKVDGKTIAPVATIEGMLKDTQNIGNNIIAVASNPGEFLSGVVGALVNKTITSLIQRGVGKLQSNIKREITNLDNKVTGAINQVDKQLGPAAKFLKTTSQRVDTAVKPYTPPPPAAGSYCNGSC